MLLQQQQQQQLQHVQDQTMFNGFNKSDYCLESDVIDGNSACGSGASSLDQLHLEGQRDKQHASSPVTLKMPIQSIGVDVPPQVLQVKIPHNEKYVIWEQCNIFLLQSL